MKLYIAEKPSLGRAIADVLPKPHRNAVGCIYGGNGDCVSCCVGHLLEQAEPDVGNASFKQWYLEHLPIVPGKWRLKPKANSPAVQTSPCWHGRKGARTPVMPICFGVKRMKAPCLAPGLTQPPVVADLGGRHGEFLLEAWEFCAEKSQKVAQSVI